MTTKRCNHHWERFAYQGSSVAPILCCFCAQPCGYESERLAVWDADPLVAANKLERATQCGNNFARTGQWR